MSREQLGPGPLDSADPIVQRLIRVGQYDDALELLRAAYQDDLHCLCRAILCEPAQAEDALHDSLIRIRIALWTYDAQRGTLRAWSFTITRNVCRTALKRRARFVSLAAPANGHSDRADESAVNAASQEPGYIVSRRAERELIRDVVAGLRRPYREAIRLAYMGDLSSSEAARILGIPEPTFRTRLYRAMAALREELRRRGLYDPGLWLEPSS